MIAYLLAAILFLMIVLCFAVLSRIVEKHYQNEKTRRRIESHATGGGRLIELSGR